MPWHCTIVTITPKISGASHRHSFDVELRESPEPKPKSVSTVGHDMHMHRGSMKVYRPILLLSHQPRKHGENRGDSPKNWHLSHHNLLQKWFGSRMDNGLADTIATPRDSLSSSDRWGHLLCRIAAKCFYKSDAMARMERDAVPIEQKCVRFGPKCSFASFLHSIAKKSDKLACSQLSY